MPKISVLYGQLAALAERLLPESLLLLIARWGIASVFFLSARTKVEGLLTITDSTYYLFETDYALPLLTPNLAAHLATYGEHLFPLMLFFGFGSRFAALGLLGMTTIIEVFVYPDAWSTHLSWAGLLLPIIAKGAGAISIDALIAPNRKAFRA